MNEVVETHKVEKVQVFLLLFFFQVGAKRLELLDLAAESDIVIVTAR